MTFRILLILRAVLYSSAFVLLWAWLAVSVRPFDARLPLTIPAWALSSRHGSGTRG